MLKTLYDVEKIREDFPILQREVHGRPLVYLDNAATTQTPVQVTQSIVDYYNGYNANIHRGVHSLSQEATDAFEQAREKVRAFFNAKHAEEIIFTSGTTHGVNLLANGYGHSIKKGDVVLVSAMEHHSNIVPWQMLCERTGASLKVIPIKRDGNLDLETYKGLLGTNTKLVFFNHVSNAVGTINPVKEMIAMAHGVGAKVMVDGAQAIAHLPVDFQDLEVDFYVGSAHKVYGPTGMGFLYGKKELLNELPPYQGGGEMIAEVSFEKTTYADLPHKFEAGTPNIAGAIAFGAALDYVKEIGWENIVEYEEALYAYAFNRLSKVPDMEILGPKNKTAVLSFNIKGIHPYDLGTILDKMGIAVRTGHHCAQPVMDFFGIPGTVRASLAIYTTKDEVDVFIEGVLKARTMLL